MRVRLVIPQEKRALPPKLHGEHYAFHNQTGTVLCGAGKDGAWVRFDGQEPYSYVGCPVAWLEKVQ